MGLDKLTDGELAYFDNDGNYNKDSKDETERIAAAFVRLVFATREKVADTKQIADGDLTTHIHIKCDGDVLGTALLELVHNMHRVVSSISRRPTRSRRAQALWRTQAMRSSRRDRAGEFHPAADRRTGGDCLADELNAKKRRRKQMSLPRNQTARRDRQ